MKQLCAFLSAVVLAFSCLSAGAESAGMPENQVPETAETAVSPENGSAGHGAITDVILTFVALIKSEDFQALVKYDDVRLVLSDIVWEALLWLWQNRPVTMKILTELGVPPAEQEIISRIWDTAEQIVAQETAYTQTEDGKQLIQEFRELSAHPSWETLRQGFISMVQPSEIQALLDSLSGTSPSGQSADGEQDVTAASLLDKAKNLGVDLSEGNAESLAALLNILFRFSWARESLHELMKTSVFWKFVFHLYQSHLSPSGGLVRTELRSLLSEPEIRKYLADLGKTVTIVIQEVSPQ